MLYIWICMFLGLTAAAPWSDDDKIINGYECAPNSQTLAGLFHPTTRGRTMVWWSGPLITSRWIISAAHCYQPPRDLIAHLGEHDVSKQKEQNKRIQVEKAIMYSDYNEKTFDYDFMLVKLAEPAQFNKYVQPIPLATSCPTVGSQCLVSGWGNTQDHWR
ncbi:unnamed protein product [Staurois parvus]|uniref:Peptidase S1 domain-containing protein n=1 Tax=Staurois parvus TaxID=386267 RepID=A0ABN9BK64_9NEOB|nr:unnamed protein product [Staurois parvus]